MNELVSAQLVEQVIPGMYVSEIPNFDKPFLSFVEAMLKENKIQPLGNFPGNSGISIHAEKMGNFLTKNLTEMKLIREKIYPWYEFEPLVGSAFMVYLATCLGKLSRVDAIPMTDDEDSFNFLKIGPKNKIRTRETIISQILPTPNDQNIDINSLVKFKEKYGDLLVEFRNEIESKCIDIANIEDEDDRIESEQRYIKILEYQKEKIKEVMKTRWNNVSLKTLIPILGSSIAMATSDIDKDLLMTGGVAISLIGSIYCAFDNKESYKEALQSPMAYVALAEENI